MLAPDTIQLERLAWAVFDNIMGPGEAPPLCRFETYDQIVGRLASVFTPLPYVWETTAPPCRQLWIEAYACALQRVAEASVGRRWITYKGIRVPKISRVVEAFLDATGTRVPLDKIRQCWPARHAEMPMQNLDGIRQNIVYKLDEVATLFTSPITWDPFVFPLTDDVCWREEALCYRPGKTLDVGTRMPGFKLMLQDDKGEYPYSGRALIFKGSMLVYDPQ